MRCYICDGTIDDPTINPKDGKVNPCRKCEAVIQECLDGFRDPIQILGDDGDMVMFTPDDEPFDLTFVQYDDNMKEYF